MRGETEIRVTMTFIFQKDSVGRRAGPPYTPPPPPLAVSHSEYFYNPIVPHTFSLPMTPMHML